MRITTMALLVALAGCGGDDDANPDAAGADAGPVEDGGPATDAAVIDAARADAGGTDAGPPAPSVEVALPAAGAEVVHSVAARVDAPDGAARVEVIVVGRPELSCSADERRFECLLDVVEVEPGPFEIEATAFDADGAALGAARLPLSRRATPDPCDGIDGDLVDCVLARAAGGASAGFEGVSYLNYDDHHARVNTDRMTGIDAQRHADVPPAPPDGVVLGVGNESRACAPAGGWISIPRCSAADLRAAVAHYEANVLLFWPEHRDHGRRDYFAWQTPVFQLSQGSSGTERDEVSKLLIALGMVEPAARAALVDAGAVASTLSMWLRRARVTTDSAYLAPETHVTALGDHDDGSVVATFAAALRAGEIPPLARLEAVATFPDEWGMRPAMTTAYAVGWAPLAVPDAVPAGAFSIDVDLGASSDPAGRTLVFFPAVLRGDPTEVTVTRLDEAGTTWRVTGPHPGDVVLETGGHERTVSRTTVGFFAHDGLYLGAPALVSVGGRPAGEVAPNSNDLD